MKHIQNLLGVVLCGGESKRMGSDKGLIEKDSETWAGLAARKLASFGVPVVISISEKQYESYSKLFSPDILVTDELDIEGPLKGLLSVYKRFPQRDILLMACDLIDMNEGTISKLVDEYQSAGDYDFFVYHDKFAEPFCAIYTSTGLHPVLEAAKAKSLNKFSFQRILDEGRTSRIPIGNKSSFKNYNTIAGHHQDSHDPR